MTSPQGISPGASRARDTGTLSEAPLAARSLVRGGASLSVEAIGDAPIAGDVPRHDGVVQTRDAERLVERFVEVLGDLGARRLHRPEFVRAARHDDGLRTVPVPGKAEAGERHALSRAFDLRHLPALAVVGRHLDLADGAASGPGQPADLVEAAAAQLLAAGGVGDHRLWSD